jgi:hypothetical protein
VPLQQIDICDCSAVTSALLQFRPDAVLHFAALTIAPESVRDPAPYWRVNTGGTLNVLDAMRDAAVPAIVFSSTAAVYGNPERIPIAEDTPLEPINPYGASKLAAERAVSSYAEAYGPPTRPSAISMSLARPEKSAKTIVRRPISSRAHSTPRPEGANRSPSSAPTFRPPMERPFATTYTSRISSTPIFWRSTTLSWAATR